MKIFISAGDPSGDLHGSNYFSIAEDNYIMKLLARMAIIEKLKANVPALTL